MSDLKDFKNKNTEFTGTTGIDLPEGNSSTRVDQQGRLRFNTQTGLAEYYNGTIWKSIDAPPAVTGASPSSVATDGSTLFTIQVSGQGFDSGGTSAKFIGADGTEYTSASVSFVSSVRVDVQTVATMTAANGPYDIQITNTGSGLSGTGGDLLSGGTGPSFTSPAADANLGSVFAGQVLASDTLTQIVASDDSGNPVTFSISSGALPSGISINPSDGSFSGTCNESDGTATFNITVSASDGINSTTRSFTISQVLAPTLEYLVVAGGGGGGSGNRGNDNFSGCGGGGAGGYRAGNISIGSSKTYTITIGSGGNGGNGGNSSAQGGTASSVAAPGITTVTSAGGGYGGRETEPGTSGGSGGGGGSRNGEGPGAGSGGSGNSPSVSPSQGNSGGSGGNESGGGGGGGAGQGGQTHPGGQNTGAAGGSGTSNDIEGPSITYAGGGGGGIHGPPGDVGPGGSGGGGNGGRNIGPRGGQPGTAGLGGGGGGAGPNTGTGGEPAGGTGGSGVVILRIPTAQYSGTTTGSPTVTTDGTDTVVKFTGNGTYVG